MNRRRFLGTLAGAGAGMAGCVSLGSGVSGTSIEHVEPRRDRERRPPIVEFDDDAGAVHVLGYMAYGSSSCDRVGIDSTTYDGDADALEIVLASKSRRSFSTACTADMAATWYRATVRFADELPQQVTVVEGDGDDPQTRTVDRSEQRELCTSEHPPDSTAAETAHWTCPERYVAASGAE
ncbi:hypothetical protein [Halomicrobium salinisoli]|uniref:hypothetical protein n=1 Tax=Halomicrobium salinisoli TaxID=2878391 RepID=UPI001CF07BAF|nr:hypothetical protein [Halomicrobium salinisoli]